MTKLKRRRKEKVAKVVQCQIKKLLNRMKMNNFFLDQVLKTFKLNLLKLRNHKILHLRNILK